jgi:hypothetical protein
MAGAAACRTNQTMQGDRCPAFVNQTMTGTLNINQVTPTHTSAVPAANKARFTDYEGAHSTCTPHDASPIKGQQNVRTLHHRPSFKATQPGTRMRRRLLMSMAKLPAAAAISRPPTKERHSSRRSDQILV